jgi:hypothetical protein
VLVVLKSSVYKHAEYLDVVLRQHALSLDDEGVCSALVCFASEVDDNRLFCFKRRPASPFPVQRVSDDGFDALPVALRCWSRDLCSKVINKCDRSTIRVNASLHQVSIEEEKQNWRRR